MFSRSLIAIDVGSSAIKIVELSGTTSKKIRSFGCELLPAGTVTGGVISDVETLKQISHELISKLRIITAGRRAAISIGGSAVVIKKIMLTYTSEDEFYQQIDYEAEQNFQMDLAELYYDHYKLSDVPDETGRIPVVLVGAKRDLVEQHIDLVRSLGMRVGVVDADVFSLINMYEYNYGITPALAGLINVGSSTTQVSLVMNGQYLFTRDLQFGGEEYSKKIMEAIGVDRDHAETLKVSASQGDGAMPEAMQKAIAEVNEQLVAEIQSTVDFYFQSGESPPEITGLSQILLAGGGCKTLGFDASLAAAMQIPVQIINPFQRVELSKEKNQLDYILSHGHLYGIAVGLGLRKMGDTDE